MDVRGRVFAIIESSPQNEFTERKAGFDQIEQSFRGGSGGPATGTGQAEPDQPSNSYARPAPGAPFIGIAIDPGQSGQGALIRQLAPGGPAQQAGLRPGDVIIGINRNQVSKPSDIPAAISKCKPGDLIELTLIRDGRQGKVQVKVATAPGQ